MRPGHGGGALRSAAAVLALLACGGPTEQARTIEVAFASVDAGATTTCAIDVERRGYCWGEPWAPMASVERDPVLLSPRELPGGHRWRVLETGYALTCGITTAGALHCWSVVRGFTGLPVAITRLPNDVGLTSVSVGERHACGLNDAGVAYCWGPNTRGELGVILPAGADASIPNAVTTTVRFRAIRAGTESTCALSLDGDVYCWGGSEVVGIAAVPRRVPQGRGFVAMDYGGPAGGRGVTCSVTGAGALSCSSYVPHGTSEEPSTPMPLGTARARDAAVGGTAISGIGLPVENGVHGCAVDDSDAAWCWGSNSEGQVGDGTTTDRPTPVRIGALPPVRQLSAGAGHSCAVTTEGALYCWGNNSRGQLGVGRATPRETTPQRIEVRRRAE